MFPVEEYALPGLRSYSIDTKLDERGFFAEVLRQDWNDFVEGEWGVQVNLSKSYPGIVRAWHRHARGQVDYILAVEGSLKIVAYDDEKNSPTRGQVVEVTAGADRLQVVRVPGYYWHGYRTVGDVPALALQFVTRLYDYSSPDEDRRPWNDPLIVDPHTGKAYDWFAPPHR